ncbi:acetate--CoA ligase family protein [Amycolatopsis thermoflava]|uniref:acetate--CoA ligase family protein n=1 Tax=Amycolatopsis thermoflava TaxID=84480 RepID=UPI00381D3933
MTENPERARSLHGLLHPTSLTVVGAGESGLGGWLTGNLLNHSTFDGPLHLVTDRRSEVFGRPTVPSIDAIEGDLDVVLVLVPRTGVPAVLRAAQARNARYAVVMAGGFAEFGDAEGVALDAELREIIAGGTMRVVGPNSPGIARIIDPLGMTIQPGFKDELRAGPIGVIAQSGGLTRCLLQETHRGFGFTAFFSAGNQIDLDIADYVDHFVADKDTQAVAMAIESLPSAERFVAAADRAHAAGKPLVMLKAGRSAAGAKAASSHTGAVVGGRAAMEAVARRHNVSVVDDINHVLNVTHYRLRAQQSAPGWTPRSQKVAVVGMSGGAAVILADALADHGVELATLGAETIRRMREYLPGDLPLSNPLDLAAASFKGTAFVDSLKIVSEDPEVGAILVVFNAWYDVNSARYADAAIEVDTLSEVPVVPVWMSSRLGPEVERLAEAGLVPVRSATEAAVLCSALLAPPVAPTPPWPDTPESERLHPGTWLEDEAKMRLAREGIRVTREEIVDQHGKARAAAASIGYPVVLKVVDDGATHRAGTGLVSGPVRDEDDLDRAWAALADAADRHLGHRNPRVLVAEFVRGECEAYIGLKRDPEWGLVMSLGLGGRWIEEIADAAVVPIPASPEHVEAALNGSKLARGMRRAGLDGGGRARLLETAVKVAAFAAAHPEISELDLNPVIVTSDDAVAVDALMTVD